MVKKRNFIIIVAVVLISFIIIGVAIYANSNIKNTEDNLAIKSFATYNESDEIADYDNDEDIIEEISDEDVLEEQEIVDENTSEEMETGSVENIETEDEKIENVSSIQETTTSNSNNDTQTQVQNTASSTNSTVAETEQQSTVETVAEETVETLSTQETTAVQQETTSTESTQSEVYWCVDGGNHHVQGDGANDHGYYSTWDLAWSACQEYMKTLDYSCNYAVYQCWCGLYYFWVE